MDHRQSSLRSVSLPPRWLAPLLLVFGGGAAGCDAEPESHWEVVSLALEEGVDAEDSLEATDEEDTDEVERAIAWPPPHLLCWDTPITEVSLGKVPDPLVAGHSLKEIVSSQVVVRPDGLVCSACHYTNNQGNPGDHYRPPVAQNATTNIYPWTKGVSKHKPAYLNPNDPLMTWRGEYGYSQTNTWMFMSFNNFFLNLALFNNKPQSIADALKEWRDDGYCQSAYPVELPEELTPAGPE